MGKRIFVGILLLTVFVTVLHTLWNKPAPLKHGVIDDVGHLLPTKIDRIVKGKEVDQLKKIVIEAKKQGKTVSIAGERHSLSCVLKVSLWNSMIVKIHKFYRNFLYL
ncbi:hypothetical protein V7148_10385 [Gottfriedia acidiceleris]|uniref:hypothetical protein n=1 Tax=Gottfriedia acidiceleris TaxID=371036 RepID=UPI0030001682